MECANEKVPVDDGSSLRVRDVMLARPKTVDARATVADLRRVFENVHVRNALLVEGGAFVGSVEREQIEAGLPDGAPARGLAHRDVPAISPEASAAEARRLMDEAGEFRLVVTGPGGRLEGLLCLNTARTGFCS
jgi:CBS domain-containing protein